MAWTCNSYFDYLFDRSPHFDEDILIDWFATDDAWIGQVMTGAWDAFSGTTHVYDRVHIGAPDLSQAWDNFDTQDSNCLTGACAPIEISVAWGSTRKTYNRERKSYTTNVLCFDQIDTRAKAKQQMAEIIRGIKEITKMVQSDYLRRNALMKADVLYIAGAALGNIPITPTMFTGAAATIDIGGAANLPTSQLTIQYLQRFYEPLMFTGYFKTKYVPNGMFKLITDPITSQQLVQMNPTLISNFKFSDFQRGGELFKYGMSAGIGNFGIAWDGYPMRYYFNPSLGAAGQLQRVFPFVNAAATIGIKPTVANEYILAPYQINFIWHPEAMRRLVPDLTPVHPEMPFLTRDLGGKWNFNMDPVLVVKNPTTGDICTIDNKRRNQGLWFADFENSIKFERPEIIRCILTQRDPGCVTDMPSCPVAPPYVVQNYADVNPVCQPGSF
jgi:hypothetical protein